MWKGNDLMDMTLETKKDITADMLAGATTRNTMKWLEGAGFYTAPASKGHHGAHEGALFEHSLQVAEELIKLTAKLGLKWERRESPGIVGLLHDVCKLDDYVLKETEEGTEVDWNRERIWPGHGSKSLIMLMGHIELTEEEKMCIMYHMGAYTDSKEWEFYSRAVKKYPNVLYTHTADMIAAHIKGV